MATAHAKMLPLIFQATIAGQFARGREIVNQFVAAFDQWIRSNFVEINTELKFPRNFRPLGECTEAY